MLDSDDEYDSEMDDFIDDSEVDQNTISQEIKSIFGYDRRRYNDYSDDEVEEASFSQQQNEERRSLQIGRFLFRSQLATLEFNIYSLWMCSLCNGCGFYTSKKVSKKTKKSMNERSVKKGKKQ